MAIRNYFARGLEKVGGALNLPEYGLSERVRGNASIPSQAASGALTFGNVPQYSVTKSDTEDSEMYGDNSIEALLASVQQDSASGGGSAAAYQPNIQILPNGQSYNLDTPQGRQAYAQAMNQENVSQANSVYDRTIGNISRSKDNLKFNAQRTLDELRSKRAALAQERENYFLDLEKQGKDFITGKSLGDTKRQNYFTSRGANAFQSSQATSQEFADNQFAQGLADQQRVKTQAEEKFNAQANAFDTDEMAYNRQLQQDEQDLNQAEIDARFNRDNYVNRAKTEIVNAFAPSDMAQGVKDFSSRYQINPYSNVNAEKADLSKAQGFTNFSSPTGPTPTSQNNYSLNGDLSPEEDYFGYKPNEKDKKNIKNYFAGAF